MYNSSMQLLSMRSVLTKLQDDIDCTRHGNCIWHYPPSLDFSDTTETSDLWFLNYVLHNNKASALW